jgi:type IV secretion system protein TrbL
MNGVWAPILAGFPNPVGWVIDKVTGFVGGVATAGFEALIGGLAAWVTDAVVWVIGGVFNFFIDSTDPNVQADWFVADDGPYGTTVAIGAALLLLFLLAGITQGVLTGDIAGMLRRFALDLPVSVLGMVGLVTVTQALIRLTDQLSTFVLGTFEDDIADFTAVVTSLASLQGGAAAALVVVLLGLVTVLAGLILVAELAVRGALIYIVVALAPLVFAARLWPSLEGVAKKLLQLLVALILSKLAMAVALAVAASAAVGAGSGGEITALPPPEAFAEDPGGSVTQAVGVLLAAVAAFGISAFSPLLVSRLLPMAEAAVVAQGIRGMPVRAGTQAASLAYYGQGLTGIRLARLAQAGSAAITATPGPPGSALSGGPSGPGPGSPLPPGRGGGGGGRPPAVWRPVPNQPDPAPVAGAAVAAPTGAPAGSTAAGLAAPATAASAGAARATVRAAPASAGAPSAPVGVGPGDVGPVASGGATSLRAAVEAQAAPGGAPPRVRVADPSGAARRHPGRGRVAGGSGG